MRKWGGFSNGRICNYYLIIFGTVCWRPDMADGKNEYSTSDSLLSSLTVLPRSELLATNSVTKNYEIQKCLKLKLYSIQPLIVWVENLPESTWCYLILILDKKNLGDWQWMNYIWKWCVVLVFIIYKNLEVSAKILSHGLSRSFRRDWLEQGSSSLYRRLTVISYHIIYFIYNQYI